MVETKKYQEEKIKVSAEQIVLTALYTVSFINPNTEGVPAPHLTKIPYK